jgi:glutathione S-transferase
VRGPLPNLLSKSGSMTGHLHLVPVNVLKGEPCQPEHVARHPFGKMRVLDQDRFRIIETGVIAPYLD